MLFANFVKNHVSPYLDFEEIEHLYQAGVLPRAEYKEIVKEKLNWHLENTFYLKLLSTKSSTGSTVDCLGDWRDYSFHTADYLYNRQRYQIHLTYSTPDAYSPNYYYNSSCSGPGFRMINLINNLDRPYTVEKALTYCEWWLNHLIKLRFHRENEIASFHSDELLFIGMLPKYEEELS